jgi:hypothetical protein
MEPIRFVEHAGHRVLLIDLTNCTPEEVAARANEVPSFVTKEPPGTVLLLADFTGSPLTRDAVERIKVAAVLVRQHLKRSAWVMPNESLKPMRDAVQTFSVREIPVFATREQALDYLVANAAAK